MVGVLWFLAECANMQVKLRKLQLKLFGLVVVAVMEVFLFQDCHIITVVCVYVHQCCGTVENAYSRAGVDLPQAFVCEPIVSTKTVGGAEGLVALATRVFLQDLQ